MKPNRETVSLSIFITTLMVIFLNCQVTNQEPEVLRPFFNEARLKAFVMNLPSRSAESSLTSLDSILKHSVTDSLVFRQTVTFLEQPLSDPNSIYRNEDLHARLLEAKIISPWYNIEKPAVKEKLKLLLQNRVGQPANDFVYITPQGQSRRMHELDADYTLLYFYNPECQACKEIQAVLISSESITGKIKSGQLKVLALYTDKDEALWQLHLHEFPEEWLHGRDQDEYLHKNRIYDLRAIPSLYLLDKNKKVLLKDCTSITLIEQTIRY
jgi:hypothetical protein